MDFMGLVKKFDRFQQQHRLLAVPLAVVKKFGDDQAGNLAALVAYFAFFSLFPLLLVFITILGYVLQNNPADLASVEKSIKTSFPALNSTIHFTTLHGSTVALVLGVVTSLWSGLGVTNAAQQAFDRVWAVPLKARASFIQAKLRGVGLLVALGVLFVLATGASGAVSGGLGGPLTKVIGIVASFLANVALFFVAFRVMTTTSVQTRDLRVGVITAATLWTILQVLGGLFIGHVTKHMSAAYASVSTPIALLIWLHLGAQMTVYSAEINVVLERKLWPRSLFGPPTEPADQETLEALAKVEERHDDEVVEVRFEGQR